LKFAYDIERINTDLRIESMIAVPESQLAAQMDTDRGLSGPSPVFRETPGGLAFATPWPI
jgi:hypothetical protein